MAISKPCPRCQQPLEIPEPIPEKVQCTKCGAVIKYKVQAAPAPVSAPAPAKEDPKPAPSVAVGKPANPAKPAPAPVPSPFAQLEESPPPSKPTPEKPRAPVAAASAGGGFVSYMHTIIPKPILFGSYGALGGLLGVLLLGELCWFIMHPTPQDAKPLVLAVPPRLTIYPASQNRLAVNIKRQGFEGPVDLEAIDLPPDLTISDATIDDKEEVAELRVKTTAKAKSSVHDVVLRATSRANPKIIASETIQIKIDPTPPNLQVAVSKEVTVYAGGQNRFGFEIARGRFEGPVRVEVLDLPKGIHIPMIVLLEKETKGVLSVVADKDVKLGPRMLLTEVRSLEDHTINYIAPRFQLNVFPPPAKLQLATAPEVTVYSGTKDGSKNKFIVKIARQDFPGDVKIEVTGAPRTVTFTSVTLKEKETDAVIEVFADEKSTPGPPITVEVTARALSKELKEEIASKPAEMKLKIELPPPAVLLAVSPKVPVYPGGTAKFGVKINRARFQGPVTISGANNQFVQIAPITIPAGETDGVMQVNVNQAALGLPLKNVMPIQITARKADGQGMAATEKVDVEILPPPSDLQLTISPEMEVYQAGKCSFTVKVARTGFLGAVQVKFNNAPAGVTLDPAVINANEIVLKGHASIDAVPKKYEIEVTGTGLKAPDGKVPTVTKTFALTVKPFDATRNPPLDIVFVLDITQSLDPEIAGLRNGIGQFVKGLKDRELEARIGLIGFRDIIYDKVPFERLMFGKGKDEYFTTDLKAFAIEVGKLKAEGGGDDPESSLDGIVEAAKYPFRDKSLKILILITDEKPQTKGNSVTMAVAQRVLKEKKIDQVHLIIKTTDLPNYTGLHKDTKGGVFEFPKTTDKVKRDDVFASLLPLLSKQIATTIGAPEPVAKVPAVPDSAAPPMAPAGEKTPEPRAEGASPNAPPPVTPQPPKSGDASIETPKDPDPPRADQVSPPTAPPATIQAVQSTGVYADKDRTQLMFAIALWTAALAGGIALMLVGAQKRYLRQSWLSVGEIIKALLAGVTAGLVAGVIGQWFYQSTSGSAWWDAISRVFAWAILGGMIGGGMGFFVPNMKWRRAVLGGCLGGVIGALGFVLVSQLGKAYVGEYIGDGPVSFLGRLVGAVLLGLCIGLMVALAEIASRRYWLEVAFGEREVRTVTLGTDTVAIGGDERLVGVYVPNAAPKALGFRVDKDRVFCEDFTTGHTSVAPPGDQRTLANAKIKVCSAASAEPTGANLQLIVIRDVPLMIGMPLTADDIPGLEAQGTDGVVALVSRRPNNPKIFLLRNRSKQTWVVTEPDGKQRKVEPGLSIELSSRCEIDFGQVKATLDPA